MRFFDLSVGVAVESTTGNIKGIKRLRRDVGPQITGYLVELAGHDPEMAREYVAADLTAAAEGAGAWAAASADR